MKNIFSLRKINKLTYNSPQNDEDLICASTSKELSCLPGYPKDVFPNENPTVINSLYCTPFAVSIQNTSYLDTVWNRFYGGLYPGLELDQIPEQNTTYTKDNWKTFGSPNSQSIWYYPGSNNYFVFHSNDGSGTQVDCMGGNGFYVEQFGPPYDKSICFKADEDVSKAKDIPGNEIVNMFECGLPECIHRQCTFQHPRTNNIYKYYNAGWYGEDRRRDELDYKAGYSEEWLVNFPCNLNATSCGDRKTCYWDTKWKNGNLTLNAYALLYSWTCHLDDERKQEKAELSSNGFGPFTGKTNVNCYLDNEPLYGRKKNPYEAVRPINFQHYVFFKDENRIDKLWMATVSCKNNNQDYELSEYFPLYRYNQANPPEEITDDKWFGGKGPW